MLNKIIIMGRLTRDPELRRLENGTAVTRYTLAVDRDFKSQNGERETDFIDCVSWRGNAEFVSKFFTKGSMAIVDGRLQLRDWTDKDGNKRRSAEVIAENVHFGESKRDGGQGNYNQGGYGQQGGYNQGNQGGYNQGGYGQQGAQPSYNQAPAYNNAPQGGGYAPPVGGPSGFSEIGEEDGDLPF